MTKTSPLSIRFETDLLDRLDRRAREAGESRAELVRRYAEEALRMEEHPQIVFRTGTTGRFAAVAGGPKVQTLVTMMRDIGASGEKVAAKVARYLQLDEALVRAGLRYYAAYRDEVDEAIRRNDEESERLHAAWMREQAIAT